MIGGKLVATLAIAAPVIALLGFGMTRDPRVIPSPLPGRAAPPFALPVFARGELPDAPDTIALREHAGRVVVLNFWASWCTACKLEHEALSGVARALASEGVQFVGVLYNDTEARAVEWIATMGGQSYPSASDPGARTAIDYGLYGVPETFIIGPDGLVVYKHVGPVTDSLLRSRIMPLLGSAADNLP